MYNKDGIRMTELIVNSGDSRHDGKEYQGSQALLNVKNGEEFQYKKVIDNLMKELKKMNKKELINLIKKTKDENCVIYRGEGNGKFKKYRKFDIVKYKKVLGICKKDTGKIPKYYYKSGERYTFNEVSMTPEQDQIMDIACNKREQNE